MPNAIGERVKVKSTFLTSSHLPVMPESELVFHWGHKRLVFNTFMLVVKLGTVQPHITCMSTKHINYEKFQCYKNAIDQNSMKALMRYLCIQLACTGMHTQISRGFQGQRGITVQVGLMVVTPFEDLGIPRLTNTFSYVKSLNIYAIAAFTQRTT